MGRVRCARTTTEGFPCPPALLVPNLSMRAAVRPRMQLTLASGPAGWHIPRAPTHTHARFVIASMVDVCMRVCLLVPTAVSLSRWRVADPLHIRLGSHAALRFATKNFSVGRRRNSRVSVAHRAPVSIRVRGTVRVRLCMCTFPRVWVYAWLPACMPACVRPIGLI